jgi:hypothetical protein
MERGARAAWLESSGSSDRGSRHPDSPRRHRGPVRARPGRRGRLRFLLWADRTQREDGYLTTPTERFATPTYALTRTRLEVDTDGSGWLLNDSWFGKVRIRGESPDAKMLFIGVGPEPAVAKYLGSVAHASVQEIDFDPFRVKYFRIAGGAPEGPPTEQSVWAPPPRGWEHKR